MTQWRHFLIFTHKRSGSIRPKGAQTGSQQAVQIFPRRESSPPGVDRLAFGFRILDPMRHEASGQQVEVSLTSNGMALHHHGRLARRDVPTWCHVRKRVHRAHHTGEVSGGVWGGKTAAHGARLCQFARASYSPSRYCSARLCLRMIYVLYPIFAGRALLAEQQLNFAFPNSGTACASCSIRSN